MSFKYNIFGVTIEVPFKCSVLSQVSSDMVPDVVVVEGVVPNKLVLPKAEGSNWQAAPGQFLLRAGRRAGRFLVEDGSRITLHRNPAAEDERLCANLITIVIVALLRQRGYLVLHANVVMTPRGAIAISGESGAGKSTTQGALMARGCRMIADDITVLYLGDVGQVLVMPGIPKLNLCEDAAIKLGYDVTGLRRNPLRKIKVFVPVKLDDMMTEPVPLKSLYLLHRHQGKNINVFSLLGAEKFNGQQECIYGPLFPDEHQNLFSIISALAQQVDMFRIERPSSGCSMDLVAEAILHG